MRERGLRESILDLARVRRGCRQVLGRAGGDRRLDPLAALQGIRQDVRFENRRGESRSREDHEAPCREQAVQQRL